MTSKKTQHAYRKDFRTVAPASNGSPLFGSPDARALRYLLYEALWENTAYDGGPYGTHVWSHSFKVKHALYAYTKGVYNPTYRLVEFWASNLWGGQLDDEAGDGVKKPSALPIRTRNDNPKLRKAIAQLWRNSRWEATKTKAARYGAMLGDSPIRLDIQPIRNRPNKWLVRIVPEHPRKYRDVLFGPTGEVIEYLFEEVRRDPRQGIDAGINSKPINYVVYREHARLEGDQVVFKTYLDDKAHNWRGLNSDGKDLPAQWNLQWPMLPLVWTQHIDAGQDFGVSEVHCGLEKFTGIDDVGSKFNDHIRQTVKSRWLLAGITAREITESKALRKKPSEKDPEPGRDEEANICSQKTDAKAHSLTSSLDLQGASTTLTDRLSEIERDYPELRYDRLRSTVESSAEALREIRKPVITKAHERRKAYDPNLCTIQALAVCVAGELNSEGFEGFSLKDFGTEAVEHSIGPRPVFEVEPLDRYAEDLQNATASRTWREADVPLEICLERAGWDPEIIQRAVKLAEEEAERAAQQALDLNRAKGPGLTDGQRNGQPGGRGTTGAKAQPRGKAPKGTAGRSRRHEPTG